MSARLKVFFQMIAAVAAFSLYSHTLAIAAQPKSGQPAQEQFLLATDEKETEVEAEAEADATSQDEASASEEKESEEAESEEETPAKEEAGEGEEAETKEADAEADADAEEPEEGPAEVMEKPEEAESDEEAPAEGEAAEGEEAEAKDADSETDPSGEEPEEEPAEVMEKPEEMEGEEADEKDDAPDENSDAQDAPAPKEDADADEKPDEKPAPAVEPMPETDEKPVAPPKPQPAKQPVRAVPPSPPPAPPVESAPPPAPAPAAKPKTRTETVVPALSPFARLENRVRQKLQAAVKENRLLHGSWVEVRPDASGKKLIVDLILDRSRASAQEAELESIIRVELRQSAEPISYRFDSVQKRAFSELLINLQHAIEEHSALTGCQVEDAYYTKDGDELVLELLGRIANNSQRAIVTNLCNDEIIPAFFNSESAKETKCKAEGLQVIAPTNSAAAYFYNAGVQKFIKGDYAGANQAFKRAILDAPQRADYQYWRIVSEIGMGDDKRAYKHLHPLVTRRRSNGSMGDYVQVLESLERVQGPIRGRLLKMEQQILREEPKSP